MNLKQLRVAIDTLLEDNPDRAEEHVYVGHDLCVSGVTVVVESEDWVPGTILLTVETVEAAEDDVDSS